MSETFQTLRPPPHCDNELIFETLNFSFFLTLGRSIFGLRIKWAVLTVGCRFEALDSRVRLTCCNRFDRIHNGNWV